jgi:uncharacterized phage protein (TIGR02218 family)
VLYEALSGFTGSELHESLGLSTDNQDLQGALRSDKITEIDILSGEYDNAEVILYRVNWQDTADKIQIKVGTLGELTRSDSYFSAEFRGLAHYLQQPQGRLYQYSCDVDFGSEKCKVNAALYRTTGTVTVVVDERILRCTVANNTFGLSSGYFTRGKLQWASGPNNTRSIEIKAHSVSSGYIFIELWQAPVNVMTIGNTFTLEAGCDKQPKTCRDKYGNFINFQGFPYMPGPDFATPYVNKDDPNYNGGSRVNIFA